MKVTDMRSPKVCFVKAGQVVQLINPDTHLPDGPFYLVTVLPVTGKESREVEHAFKSNGLYSDPRTHLLVNLETGLLCPMPHLSSRVDIIYDAALVLKDRPA